MNNINIELTSAYRNRFIYPNPCNFIVPINTVNEYYNSTAYPYYNFEGCGSNLNKFPVIKTSSLYPSTPATPGNDNPYGSGTFELPLLDYNISSNCDQYYTGNYFKIDLNNSSSLIIDYSNVQRKCRFNFPPHITTQSYQYQINNLSTNSSITIQGGITSGDIVANSYLENVNIAKHFSLEERFKFILRYDAITKLAELESEFPIDNTKNYLYYSWQPNDKYRIRLEKPLLMGFGFNNNDNYPWIYKDIYSNYCNAGISSNCLYKNAVYDIKLLNSTGNFNKGEILTLDGGVKIEITNLTLNDEIQKNGFIIVNPGNGIEELNIIDYHGIDRSLSFQVLYSAQSIDISNAYKNLGVTGNLSKTNDFYKDLLLFIPYFVENLKSTCTNPSFYRNYPVLIDKKNNVNTTAAYPIISSMYDKSTNDGFLIINCCDEDYIKQLNTPIIYDGTVYSYDWEILNKKVFNSSLSTFYNPRNEMQRCYKVVLQSIILPNEIIKNGKIKGYLSFNDVLYLEIFNKTLQSSNIIKSNNKHLHKTTFKIPITNIYFPVISRFVKLNSIQVPNLYFKLNDEIGIKLIQTDGKIVEFEEDLANPAIPNPLKQITVNLLFIPIN